ncbi:MAG: PAS domain S-box protein [Bacteroidota bacterium]
MSKDESKTAIEIKRLKLENELLKQRLSEKHVRDEQGIYANEYESLYHNIPMGIMHYDSNGIIIDCNDLFVNMIGSSHEVLVGLDMFNHLQDKKIVDAIKQSLITGHATYKGIYKSLTANKKTHVKILFKGTKNNKNKISGGICIAEDMTESIKNKLALDKSEENYNLIFENTTDVYYRVDKDGTILSMSPAVKDLLLLDDYENIIGKNVIEFYYNPSDREKFVEKLRKEGTVQEYRLELKRTNGFPITVEFNSKIILDNNGEFDSIIGVFYDVTSRIEAEIEKSTNIWFFERLENFDNIIRSSVNINEVYKGVVASAMESFQCDSSFILSYSNGDNATWQLEASIVSDSYLCNGKPEMMIIDSGKSDEIFDRILMYETLVLIDANNLDELNNISKEMGVKAQMMTSIHVNSGNSLILCVNHCKDDRVWNDHEKALFSEMTSRLADATNTFESTELLFKSEEHHRRLIEATSEGYWEINKQGIIKVANNAMCEMLGFSMNEIIGKSSLVFTAHESRLLFEEIIDNTNDKSAVSFEIELLNKIGKKVYTLFSITRREDTENNNVGAFFFVTDITKQKEALYKAEESDKLKSVFIKNISHEVRTPLNGIIGFLEMLNDDSLSKSERVEYTKYVIASSDQLTTIITDLLEYSRLEAGQVTCVPKVFNLNKLLDELYEQFILFANTRNKTEIKLTLEKTLSDEQSNITIDKIMVKQIFSSLLNNAIKFTTKGEVKFGYKLLDKDNIRFYVIDTGIGIPDSDREIIFEKFRNGSSTNNAVYGGNGLGLSISKSLTELLGGHIWFDSEVGVGTKFYVNIPISKIDILKKDKYLAPKIKTVHDWINKKVLIVDDVYEVYVLISVYLRETKVITLYAKNGADAINLVKQNPDIDIVLLDIHLPDKSGYEVVKEMKSMRTQLPIIAQTAFALNDDKEKALTAGFNDYTTKPIYRKTLMDLIAKYL